jgi:hypothetical protein
MTEAVAAPHDSKKSKHFFLWMLLFPCLLSGAPIGNPASPSLIQEGFVIPKESWANIRGGYEGNFVGDAKMTQKHPGSGNVDSLEQYTNSASITLNLLERLDLFTILGSSRLASDWRIKTPEGAITRLQMETQYNFLWNLGIRAILVEWGNLGLELGGRYFYANYKPNWVTSNAVPESTKGSKVEYRGWQSDLSLYYKIELLTPYIGVFYEDAHACLYRFHTPIAKNNMTVNHFKTKNPIGLVIGCGISNGKYFMMNVEGRFIAEQAVSISGDLRF